MAPSCLPPPSPTVTEFAPTLTSMSPPTPLSKASSSASSPPRSKTFNQCKTMSVRE
ncbi:hypothetical protein AHAS_Ahas17G0155000 [Arachis hypogaea]